MVYKPAKQAGQFVNWLNGLQGLYIDCTALAKTICYLQQFLGGRYKWHYWVPRSVHTTILTEGKTSFLALESWMTATNNQVKDLKT